METPVVNVVQPEVAEVLPQGKRVFTIGIFQKVGDSENSHTLKFELPEEQSNRMGIVLGTAINRLFKRMELSKTFKSTFIKGTEPFVFSIKGEHWDTEKVLGKVTEELTEVLKLNNGLLSKRSFIDKVVDMWNFTSSKVEVVDIADVKSKINEVLWAEQPKIKNEGIKSIAATRVAADKEIVLN
jgi:hypothetical protein